MLTILTSCAVQSRMSVLSACKEQLIWLRQAMAGGRESGAPSHYACATQRWCCDTNFLLCLS